MDNNLNTFMPKPEWLRVRHRRSLNQTYVEEILRSLKLNTVCREANCPNYLDCFSRKTATFMILGAQCTRDCRFCNVRNGEPEAIDPNEPANIAEAVKKLGLTYVVVTSVTRDDLSDGGAGHFASVVKAIRLASPMTAVETLIPDFQGSDNALRAVADAAPTVISHNIETIKALYPKARPQAIYERSLRLIKNIKLFNPGIRSKSGIMVGLGETEDQVNTLFEDLLRADCEFLTIGQYLAPSKRHLPVEQYVEPAQFEVYADAARRMGFKFVASAPFVRSSYHAADAVAGDNSASASESAAKSGTASGMASELI